jgi:hypothetical protein
LRPLWRTKNSEIESIFFAQNRQKKLRQKLALVFVTIDLISQLALYQKRFVFLSGLPDGIFFKPKIQIWVNFLGSFNERLRYILCPFGICRYFTVIWYT